MALSILITICFFSICTCFGFFYLSKILKINSLLFLISFSTSLGISSYIFLCHLLSFIMGPSKASEISLCVLLALTIIIFLTCKIKEKLFLEFSKNKFGYIILITIIIIACTFSAIYKHSIHDQAWHIPLAQSIYKNSIYPLRDFLRPDYALIYHFGGDLFSGAINHLSKIGIFNSFEVTSSICGGITFLSLFCLAWILTKKYKLSLISAFCCYFGSGLLWLNALSTYTTKNTSNLSFIEIFLSKGIYGYIYNSPSITTFSSSSSLGYPILILCFFLFYILTKKNNLKDSILYILSLPICLLSLSLCAGWLCLSFLASISLYLLIILLTTLIKKRKIPSLAFGVFTMLFVFILLNIFFRNEMYSQDQFLGRSNIFNIVLKENPFTVTAWSSGEVFTKTISCFSWDFIQSFGLSLILLPIVFIYLLKYKNKFSILLFLVPLLTMPLPLLFEFKLSPVDFNRLFGFGNIMLILLTTTGIGLLYKNFTNNKLLLITYVMFFCLSSLAGLLIGVLFCPQMYSDAVFTKTALHNLSKTNSFDDLFKFQTEITRDALMSKYLFSDKYKSEVNFFTKYGMSSDVAISSIPGIPIYSGVYTLIPSMMYGLKSQIYSGFDNIYPTVITTLDPHLLNELNIKWVGYDEVSKKKLPKETLDFLNDRNIFMLVYSSQIEPDPKNKISYQIFQVSNLTNQLQNYKRQAGWILVDKEGNPIEIIQKLYPNISLFTTEKNALQYLKKLISQNLNLKTQLITAQPIIIKITQEQLAQSGLSIKLEEHIN